jgi:hypothetical protein
MRNQAEVCEPHTCTVEYSSTLSGEKKQGTLTHKLHITQTDRHKRLNIDFGTKTKNTLVLSCSLSFILQFDFSH